MFVFFILKKYIWQQIFEYMPRKRKRSQQRDPAANLLSYFVVHNIIVPLKHKLLMLLSKS